MPIECPFSLIEKLRVRLCRIEDVGSTVQFQFSDNLWYSDYFAKNIYYIKSYDLVTLCDLVIVFAGTKSVTKSRVHCTVPNCNQKEGKDF